MMRSKCALCILLALVSWGCPPPEQGGPPDLTGEDVKLKEALRDYKLPSRSVPPAPSSEVEMELAFNKMAVIATDQKLIFDGTRASRGLIVVGKQGANGPMIVGVAIVPKGGYVAMLDVPIYDERDTVEAEKMHEAYITAVKRILRVGS